MIKNRKINSKTIWQIVQTILLLIIGIPFLINFPDITKTHEILMAVMFVWVVIFALKQNYKNHENNKN